MQAVNALMILIIAQMFYKSRGKFSTYMQPPIQERRLQFIKIYSNFG